MGLPHDILVFFRLLKENCRFIAPTQCAFYFSKLNIWWNKKRGEGNGVSLKFSNIMSHNIVGFG